MSSENPTSAVNRHRGASPRSHRFITALTTVGERAGNALVYSSTYLVGIALVEVAIVMVLLGLQPNPAPVIVGLITFGVYAYDRLIDVDADAVVNPKQAAFVRRHRDTLYVLASMAYAVAVAIAVLNGPMAFALALLPGMVGVLYASEWIPDVGVRADRLKDLLVVNTGVVAGAWAVTLTFLPLAVTDAPFGPTAGLVFGYFFVRMFVDTELSNVGDVEGDRETGVATVPVVFGVRRTRHVLYALDVLTLCIVGFAILSGFVPLALGAGLAVGVAYSFLVVSRVGRSDDDRVSLACEFESVVAGAAMVAFALI